MISAWQNDDLGEIILRRTLRVLAIIGTSVVALVGWHTQAQVAADTGGVTIKLKVVDAHWSGLSGESIAASITGLTGTQSTDRITSGTSTSQIITRLAVGKTYSVNMSISGNTEAVGGTLLAIAPPGYTTEIAGVPREQYAFTYYDTTIKFRVRPETAAGSARAGTATALGVERTLWQASLGELSTGAPAGVLSFIDTGAGSSVSSIFSPGGLVCEESSSDVLLTYNSSGAQAPYVPGTLRQIIAPQVCVDVVMTGSDQCELKFYHRAQLVAQGSDSLCSFSGFPYAWYFFNQTGSQPDAVTISCDVRDITGTDASGQPILSASSSAIVRTKVTTLTRTGTSPNYSWTATQWCDSGGNPLSQSDRTRSNNTETITMSSPAAAAATKLTRTYSSTAWGEEVATETLGTLSPTVTNLDYWSSTGNQSASYAQLKSKISGGQWEGYEYYDYDSGAPTAGMVYRVHRPFAASSLTVPEPLSSNNDQVTTYSYGLDAYGRATRPTRIETKIGGTTVSLSETTYTDAWDPWFNAYFVTATGKDYNQAGTYRTSITKYFREDSGDFYRLRAYSVKLPDGTQQSYAYQPGTWSGTAFSAGGNGGTLAQVSFASKTVIISGRSSSPGTQTTTFDGDPIDPIYLFIDQSNPNSPKYKCTADITIRDNYARIVRTEKLVWNGTGWQLVSAENFQWNYSNQLIRRAANASATYDVATGIIYDATYTGERLTSQTNEAGVTTSYTYDSADRVDTATQSAGAGIGALITKYSYDAANHVTGQTVGWTQSEQLVTTRAYDDAGRISVETVPGPNGGLSTHYDYEPSNRKSTVTLPNGGTRITQLLPSGSLVSETGTAAVATYHQYIVDGAGIKSTVYYGLSGSSRYADSWQDWLGRTVKTSKPVFGGQLAYIEESIFDDNTGRLSKTSRHDSANLRLYADIYYLYDELGNSTGVGLDVDNSGGVVLASSDRIQAEEQYFEQTAGAWWATHVTKTYPTLNSGTEQITSIQRTRLTGLSDTLRAESQTQDVYGSTTTVDVIVDRTGKTVTTNTTKSGFANTRSEVLTNGLRTSVMEFDGLTYLTGYDSLHRANSSTDPRTGTTTTYFYSGSTSPARIWGAIDAAGTLGNVSQFAYDIPNRITRVTDAAGKSVYTQTDPKGSTLHQWGDGTYPVEYVYDPTYGDRLEQHTFQGTDAGGGNFTGASWPGGTPASITKWTYDAPSGLVSAKTDAANNVVGYTYNSRGQVATRTWARGVVATYGYDGNTGELTGINYSDNTPAVSYSYNRSGTLNQISDVTGTRTFNYNQAGASPMTNALQLDSVSLPAYYGTRFLTRKYDSIGRGAGFGLGSTFNSSSDLNQAYTYNGQGRFDHLVVSNAADATARTFTYPYNGGGFVGGLGVSGTLGSAGSFGVTKTYEAHRDLLQSISTGVGPTVVSQHDYTYNALGQRATSQQSGSAFADFGTTKYNNIYNSRGELTSSADYLGTDVTVGANQMSDRNFYYSFDNIGNRTASSRHGNAGTLDAYSADTGGTVSGANNLNQYRRRTNAYAEVAGTVSSSTTSVGVSGGGFGWSGGFARQGNYWADDVQPGSSPQAISLNVSATGTFGGTAYQRTDTSKTLYFPGAQTFSYDADGNLINDGVWTYSYDAENRLISMTSVSITGFQSKYLDFQYDYLNRRVQKHSNNTTTGTQSWRRYIYDGNNLVAELDVPGGTGTPAVYRSYAWGLDLAGSLTATGGVGALVQITKHTGAIGSYFPTYDGNGNVTSLVSTSTGGVSVSYEYSPFGEVLRRGGATYTGADASILDNPFAFSTKFTDWESGLVYYGDRYYSSSLGRFINRDPIEEAGGLNLYAFCGNDGVNRWDYLGHGDDPLVLAPVSVSDTKFDKSMWNLFPGFNDTFDFYRFRDSFTISNSDPRFLNFKPSGRRTRVSFRTMMKGALKGYADYLQWASDSWKRDHSWWDSFAGRNPYENVINALRPRGDPIEAGAHAGLWISPKTTAAFVALPGRMLEALGLSKDEQTAIAIATMQPEVIAYGGLMRLGLLAPSIAETRPTFELLGRDGVDIAEGDPVITVIGSLEHTAPFAGRPGFNVLRLPDSIYESMTPAEFDAFNTRWMQAAIGRGDQFWLATDPIAHAELMEEVAANSRYLDLELPLLEQASSATARNAYYLNWLK